MLQRKRKLKSIRDPASRKVRSEFDQPRLALRLFSKAQAGYAALTLIKAPAVLDLNSRRLAARQRTRTRATAPLG
jgi:hypothetical protein